MVGEVKFNIKFYLFYAILIITTFIAFISSKFTSIIINKYTFTLTIIILSLYLDFCYHLELILLGLITIFILLNLFIKLFFTPGVILFFNLFQQKVLNQFHLAPDIDKKGKILIENINNTAVILRKKYFSFITSIYFFFYTTLSFIIFIFNGSVLLYNIYEYNNSTFNFPDGYSVNFGDFLLMSTNSFLLIDYSIISSNSYFVNVILTFHSFIFIIITVACLYLLSIITNYEPVDIRINENDNSYGITNFNHILQNYGIVQALKYYIKKFENN